MNLRRAALAAIAAAVFALPAFAVSDVVISQVYGGGGNSGATYKNDFVELFNRGTSTVSLDGWTVQYASSAGTSWQKTALSGSIAPGQYYLVQEAAGSGGTVNLPTPDASGGISMAAGSGKVALVASTTTLAGTCPAVVDFVGFGSANCFEGFGGTPVISNTTAALRASDGCTDTDDNSADFSTGAPNPRNSASPTHACGPVNAAPTITPPANPITTVDQGAAPFTVTLSGNDDGGVYLWSATPGDGVVWVLAGAGPTPSDVTYTVALNTLFSGTASFTASLSDGVNPPTTQTVNIAVTPTVNHPPTIDVPADPIATVNGDSLPFTVTLTGHDDGEIYHWSATPGTGVASVLAQTNGASSGSFSVSLYHGFVGTASFTASLDDTVNPAVTQTVNITVNVPPPPPGTIVISQFYGGGHNAGSTYNNDFIELFNNSDSPVNLEGWAVQSYSFFTSAWAATPLHGTIAPHSYYLVQEIQGSTPGGGTTPLPSPDQTTDPIDVGSTSGHVALTTTTEILGTRCSTSSAIADFVGYSGGDPVNNATCSGRATIPPILSNTLSASRVLGGCKFTGSATDWSIGAPAPRNSSTPSNDCSNTSEETAPHVMISQIYGGGGNGGALLTNDYIELYNPGTEDAPLDGWSVQYASSTGSSWQVQPLGGSVPAGGYFLIELAAGADTTLDPLPPPRIISDINMSGSTGKVALVRKYTPLSGTCPIADPDLVDFVGYGSANCFEGGLQALTLSNSEALRRIANSDTNQNRNDFERITANASAPRGSGALVELAPFLINFEPAVTNLSATNPNYAAHDASIVVNFSEAVNVADGWFNIDCDDSATHTDVVVNSAFGGETWIITPNPGSGFTYGATCTIHIFKDFVTDVDTNDGPDNLTTDASWTFKVAPDDAIETPDVHLTMGNPSDAVASLASADNYLMKKPSFALSYNHDHREPNWVSWHLTAAWTGGLPRVDTFRPDPELPPDWRVLGTDYAGSGFDRGHMCPNADRDGLISPNRETFLMTNMVPQSAANNQGPWAKFEAYLRTLVPANELYIVSGPYGNAGTLPSGVVIPEGTWKVVVVLPAMDGNDVDRVTPATRTIAIRIPNDNTVSSGDDYPIYLTTVHAIEQLTGYDFYSNVPRIIQNSIEYGSNGTNPPGVENESVAGTEDQTASVSLHAVSPYAGTTFVYTIDAQPSHGSVTCSGADCTYTPAPDFYGNDSFAFHANDGHADSNVATVTIHVSEVNDAPVPVSDAVTAEAGAANTYPASSLIVNDSPGANEAAQSLNVTSVAGATNGTVSLAGGVVTFNADANVGSGSFTYQVCDNGTTAGAPDSKCSTGTVAVTINDTTAPSVTGIGTSVTQLWPANHQMVEVTVPYTASDAVGVSQCSLSVLSNEPVDGLGDGDMAPDWVVVDAHHVKLRAERSGLGNGRVYTITASCADASGNVGTASAAVNVPKSQK